VPTLETGRTHNTHIQISRCCRGRSPQAARTCQASRNNTPSASHFGHGCFTLHLTVQLPNTHRSDLSWFLVAVAKHSVPARKQKKPDYAWPPGTTRLQYLLTELFATGLCLPRQSKSVHSGI